MQSTFTLQGLGLGFNKATVKAADNIAAVLRHNTYVQELDLNGNKLQVAGIIKIAKSLQHVTTLKQLGLGYNNATKEAAWEIADVVVRNVNLQVLNLNCNNLQTAGFIRIARALICNHSLIKLHVGDNNINEKALDYIIAVLSHNPNLYALDLSGNNLQLAGIIKIVKHVYALKTLKLNHNIAKNCEDVEDDAASIDSCITEVPEFHESSLLKTRAIKITKFLLSLDPIQDDSTIASTGFDTTFLSHGGSLQILALNDNKLQGAGATMVITALQHIFSLSELYLSNNDITETAARSIAEFLSQNINLQVLDLNRNNLRAAGIIMIAKCLQKFSTLQKLCLGYNNCTAEAADDIAAILLQNANLVVLDLSGNDLQLAGFKKVARALRCCSSSLTELYISSNNFTEEAADDIAAVVLCNANLRVLELNNNDLRDAGIIKVAKALQHIQSLTTLCVQYNSVSEEAADYIKDIFSHNTKLIILGFEASD